MLRFHLPPMLEHRRGWRCTVPTGEGHGGKLADRVQLLHIGLAQPDLSRGYVLLQVLDRGGSWDYELCRRVLYKPRKSNLKDGRAVASGHSAQNRVLDRARRKREPGQEGESFALAVRDLILPFPV